MQKERIPQVPYADARVISTRISPEFHKQLRQFAVEQDCSVATVLKTALELHVSKRA